MKKIRVSRTTRTERIVFFSVMSLMVLSFFWSFGNIFFAPLEYSDEITLIKNDYILMTSEAVAAIFVLLLPTILEKKWKFDIPSKMHIFLILFLFSAVFLGEFRRFHFLVPHWDKMLHIVSGAFLASLGFTIIQTLNDHDIIHMNPLFVAIFSFSFAITIGTMWELYEYAWDVSFNLNMMKYMDEAGNPYVGLEALKDTMGDLVVDSIGAFAMSTIGYIAVKLDKLWLHDFIIYRQR
ncbi:MAG: hypothetical protein WCZ00_02185 [Acholeplasmataceae bacterium]